MLFNSFHYLLFLPLVAAAYFALGQRFRPSFLLLASCYFYMAWKLEYVLVMLGSALLCYGGGLLIDGRRGHARKLALTASVGACLGLLVYYKYAEFAAKSLNQLLGIVGSPPVGLPEILLPVGISFHVFQAIAYCVDVYRGQPAERRLGAVTLYIAFFPQSVAGPIERPSALLPQFYQSHTLRYDDVVSGLRLILWGLFKKVFIADRLAIYVDQVYATPMQHQGLPVILAFYFFAFQIYCDFSGYTDMARGSARIFGIHLVPNFRAPYLATSVAAFWHRWHLSLSTWFRDYVYIPLGGSRGPRWRWVRNIVVTFCLSGLWHGAAWNFVLWGLMHGALMAIAPLLRPLRPGGRWGAVIAGLATFHAVVLSWVAFRAPDLAVASTLLGNAFAAEGTPIVFDGGLMAHQLVLAVGGIALLMTVEAISERVDLSVWFASRRRPWRWLVYYAAIFLILLVPGGESSRAFIYFQF
ncbi:MAG: MBOAT family protein [Magnetospirillum sp.]|nr:MBOAT family protein [Magnetospirillum sp.]